MENFEHLFNSKDSNSKDVEMDNMIKKLQIEMSGGKLIDFSATDVNMPPEIESEFLDAILEFERFKKNAKFQKVSELTGIKTMRNEDEMSSDELIIELDSVKKKLKEFGVEVSSIKDIDDRSMYKLVREKILDVDVPDINIKGMIHNFFYEDFYRDEEIEVMKITEFFLVFFGLDKDELPMHTKNAMRKLSEYKNFFKEITISDSDVKMKDIKKTVAYVYIDVKMEAQEIDDDTKSYYQGELKLKLKKSSNNWKVEDFWLPL